MLIILVLAIERILLQYASPNRVLKMVNWVMYVSVIVGGMVGT